MRSRSGTVRRIEAQHAFEKLSQLAGGRYALDGHDRRQALALGYDKKLYILAFDHRGLVREDVRDLGPRADGGGDGAHRRREVAHLRGLPNAPSPTAHRETPPESWSTASTDRRSRGPRTSEGYLLAMPVEKSGQNEFDFEYGEQFGEKIEEFDPSFSKVLVRYNPEGDQEMNERQSARLKRLSDWLHEHDRKFLFELLVPAEEHQLESVGGDADRYDTEIRPGLMMRAIEELQAAGIEPDIWKIEGIDDRDECRQIAELVRRDGRDGVSCVVLGRGASDAKVDEWLRAGAGAARLRRVRDRALDLRRGGQGARGRRRLRARRRRRVDRVQVPPLHRRLLGRGGRSTLIATRT